MGFYLDGYVLRPARVGRGNSPATAEATSGVDRDHCQPADYGYDLNTTRDVAPYADMYRAAVLDRPDRVSEEYCVWAATTGNLSNVSGGGIAFQTIGDPKYVLPIAGTLTVLPLFEDGTDKFIVRDAGGRDIESVSSIMIITGLGVQVPVLAAGGFTFDSASGILTLSAATLLVLGGGFSEERRDKVLTVFYALASVKCWWSRNDSDVVRFGWNGKTQRWEPYQGGPPRNLGVLTSEDSYTATPRPTRFEAGDYLGTR